MTKNTNPTPPTVSPVTDKETKSKTPHPPNPKEVIDTVDRQHAAKPGQGPKSKGRIG